MSTPRRHRLRLVTARPLSPSVRELSFAAIGAPPQYRAGQSMNLYVPSASGLVMRRPYSVASAPNSHGRLDFAVTQVEGGPTSTTLHALMPGALIDGDGPNHGHLGRRDGERDLPLLMVATGSGLAPFRALLQEELARPSGPPIGLLFGCRTEADILWRNELAGWAATFARFHLTVTLSRPCSKWRGPTGWVQRHVIGAASTVAPALVLLCGLSPMTDAVERLLQDAGVPSAAIRSEAFDR